jgi:predicted AAA+ superfamily ATPase
MIKRELYLNQLRDFIDKPLIKVITGIRRCGKSAMLYLLKNELLGRGVSAENIVHVNFESFEYSDLCKADKLYAHIKSKIINKQPYYILLDEIQEVNGWEKAVDAFLVDFNADIYITGSNSRLLSSELATYLAGRYVEIRMYPLSFSEYLHFRNRQQGVDAPDLRAEFFRFLRLGGFPVIHLADYTIESAYKVIHDIYSSAILRDTVQRHNIRDVELLERVVRFVFDNVGSKFSAKNVADYFKSQQRKIDLNTIYNYLNALESAFIIHKVPRYDVKGREILKTFEKYFVGDHSLIYALMGFRDRWISGVLENMVMLELKRRGFRVFVGKADDKEIDFVAEKQERKVYVQVSYKMTEQSTIVREFSPLKTLRDNHPKYVVSMDETWTDNIDGIPHVHIADFLLMDAY